MNYTEIAGEILKLDSELLNREMISHLREVLYYLQKKICSRY